MNERSEPGRGSSVTRMICGVDEAGKGPVLGPMVIAGVACSNLSDLAALGVMDSKVLSPKRREALSSLIREQFPYTVVIRTAADIDTLRDEMTMNEITARAHAEVVKNLDCPVAWLDACDVNEDRYGRTVAGFIGKPCEVIARHKADRTCPVVSAASIVAKVVRDAIVSDYEEEYGTIGSGYPADPVTIAFLAGYIRDHGYPPPIARRSWATVKNLMNQAGQQKLF
ncbi:ribonuclease HII [Methanospirillum sp.]|uniref:ribonuclease HII n=1 Tax=Methanospirillum sp. TaxID=45200 RepID=UPI00345C8D69